MKYFTKLTFFTSLLLLTSISYAQDTLRLSLQEVESLFLKKNLLLLAQQYDIDRQEALIIQAKVYPNPIFSADFNAYDPENRKVFHTGNTGQKGFVFEQLIILAGKRKAEISIAKKNKELAQQELADLLRNLQWQLHNNFFQLYQQNKNIEKFNAQLQSLESLINSYEIQSIKGNIPLKDVVRLKSTYLELNNSKSAAAALRNEMIKNLQILTQSDANIIPEVLDADIEKYNLLPTLDFLLAEALANRPDMKIADIQNGLAGLNVTLQKKMTIPDITANTSYDQRSGAFVNQMNVGFSIPLPLWNKNKGNIKSAEIVSSQAKILYGHKQTEIQSEVQEAWKNMQRSINEYAKIKQMYNKDFEAVFNGVNDNFQKKNLSILEFVDFIESYNNSLAEYRRVKTQLALSAGQINYITASNIY